MKKSLGFTLVTPTVITIVTMIASFGLLSVAMKTLPLGTAYTIWTGIGAVGAFILGIAVLGESVTCRYVAHPITEGLSKLEAIRCAKRYIAREVFSIIQNRNRTIKQNGVSGRQYLSIIYTARLTEAGVEPSVSSVGIHTSSSRSARAFAETINCFYTTELIHRQKPWHNKQDLEMAALGWDGWFYNHRLLVSIGSISPADTEENFYAQFDVFDMIA